MAVSHIGHVHGRGIGRALVVGHSLVGDVGLAVLHFQERAMGEYDMIAVAGIIVGKLPVALEAQAVRLAYRDPAAGLPVEPFVDRGGNRAKIFAKRWGIRVESGEDESAI